MDGQAVLDYLRVRKNHGQSSLSGGKGDLNRVNRQKEMLVALFENMKSRDLITKLPNILQAFEGQLYTNTTFDQIAALALFAYNLDSKDIKMHSMDGTMGYKIFNWNFCLTNQKKRVDIIKEVYGIDVKQYSNYTPSAAWAKWYRMLSPVYEATASRVLAEAETILAADKLLPTVPPAPIPDVTPVIPPDGTEPVPDPTPTENTGTETAGTTVADQTTTTDQTTLPATGDEDNTGAVGDGTAYRKYGEAEDALYQSALSAYNALVGGEPTEASLEAVYNSTIALANALGIPVETSKEKGRDWHYEYEYSKNEIYVDFN